MAWGVVRARLLLCAFESEGTHRENRAKDAKETRRLVSNVAAAEGKLSPHVSRRVARQCCANAEGRYVGIVFFVRPTRLNCLLMIEDRYGCFQENAG